MVFPGTHNSYSALWNDFSALVANQRRGIRDQLEAGIRVLLLDVHEEYGATALCHGLCMLGSQSHLEALREIRDFLESHPREVLTILYEDHVPPQEIEEDFLRSDLIDFVYIHSAPGTWPTLGEMIESGGRLVVMAENEGGNPAWYHDLWDLAWDTPFDNTSLAALDCRRNRGSSVNGLFLMNHWANSAIGLPSEELAYEANQGEVLLPRTLQCLRSTGRIPNFIAVNFYESGDLFRVVDFLNSLDPGAEFPRSIRRAIEDRGESLPILMVPPNGLSFRPHP